MTVGELVGALGKACGRFEEGYGSDFDARDPVDVHALADLLHADLQRIVEREVADRLDARYEVESERMARDLADGLTDVFNEGAGHE